MRDVTEQRKTETAEDMRQIGAELTKRLRVGDVVLLFGELGAGKTTLVRGFVEALGFADPVRSPTFNLVQFFETVPPVMHADLYRVSSHANLGIEDEIESHVSFIEWAEKAAGLVRREDAWRIQIEFSQPGRIVSIQAPTR